MCNSCFIINVNFEHCIFQGYGDNKPKSSSTPQEVKTLDNVYIHSVTGGFGHTLLIARVDEDSEKERIAKLPIFKP